MKNKLSFLAVVGMAAAVVACKKNNDAPYIPPSDGQVSFTLNGGTGGASAVNSAYVDMSTDKGDSVKRASWDLGFFCGAEFKVALNNTTSAAAKVTTATDLAAIGAADTIGLTLAINQIAPLASDYAYFDAIDGTLSTTAIPTVSATASDSKVVIINRGEGGGIAKRPWIKVKVTRNTSGGYTLQYGTITQTTGFTSVDVSKDADYNFKFVSFDGGAIVKAEPKKLEWDFTWGASVYETNFGVMVPYNFSDLVAINVLGGVKAYEEVYADAATRDAAFTAYNVDSINATSNASLLAANRWAIGSKWRTASQTTSGVKTDRFYIVKDAAGNYYKVKFISMGTNDGGERGKPKFQYTIIK